MHVRGSSLSQPRVVEALRPFIVSFWAQKDNEPVPVELRPYYQATGRGHSNVRCFVLDSTGAFRHGFDGFPAPLQSPLAFDPEAFTEHYLREIARGSAGLALPVPKDPPTVRLPDVADGVRIFVRLPDRRDTYGYPVVETVANRDEWKTLAYPEAPREIEAAKLSRWLSQCYPSGVNEQLQPFRVVRGKLKLAPAGAKEALLTGPVRMAMTADGYELFEGNFQAVVTYDNSTRVRGVLDGIYWRQDPRESRWREWKITAAIESRPQ